jgi:ABC-2 type transport system permease protein
VTSSEGAAAQGAPRSARHDTERRRGAAERGGAAHPLVELTLARVREFAREPEALFWTFLFPVVMAVAMAVAFPNRTGRAVVAGVPAGNAASALRRALAGHPNLEVRDVPPGAEMRALREGDVHIMVLPSTPPTYRFDPGRDESGLARAVVDDALQRAAGRVDPWTARAEPVSIPGSRYVDWLLPGLVGMTIMGTSLWGIGFPIVQTRQRKLLKRMAASPMRKRDYLLAQVGARLTFLAPEAGIPLLFGAWALGMPVLGSVLAIAVVSMVGALAFGGIGLLVASRPKTFEAISGILNFVMLPMWMLSGIFFSASNFPASAQPFIQALPLTALIDALRAVILDGASLWAVRGDLLWLGCWAVVPFAVALRVFRWR